MRYLSSERHHTKESCTRALDNVRRGSRWQDVGFHVMACASNTLKRKMELGVKSADHLRAAVVDLFTPLFQKQWETEATSATQLLWITDCDSPRSALVRPAMGKSTGKRLGEASRLRLSVHQATKICRWVDTDCMLADAPTKQMTPEKLVATINTNTLGVCNNQLKRL